MMRLQTYPVPAVRRLERGIAVVSTVAVAFACMPASADDYYFDVNGNAPGFGDFQGAGWDTTTANWTTDPTGASDTIVWTDGNTAIFDLTASGGGGSFNVVAADLTLAGLRVINGSGTFATGSGTHALHVSGGTVEVEAGTFQLNGGGGKSVYFIGDLTKTGGGVLEWRGNGNPYVGTATIDNGTIYVSQNSRTNASSHFALSSPGGLRTGLGSYTIGSLSGDGTIDTSQAGGEYILNIDQATNTTFSGLATDDVGGGGKSLSLNKLGAGSLTLDGSLDYRGSTSVTGGTLVLNSTSAIIGSAGFGVSASGGGTLAGIGTIDTQGQDVTITDGSFAPGSDGNVGTVGEFEFDLGDGQFDLSGLAGSGGLRFDLDTVANSDLVTLIDGILNIGAGTLDFSDFDFSALGGFGEGTYTLFSTSDAIIGTLGGAGSGTIAGLGASLALGDGGTDLVLHVVPEPASLTLLALGGMAIVWRRRAA